MAQESEKRFYIQASVNKAQWMMLLEVAKKNFERAKSNGDDFGLDCVAAITFSAIGLEAYFNALGFAEIESWKDFESSSIVVKYRVICLSFDIKIEYNKSVYQTLKQLVRWRNEVAHSKYVKPNINYKEVGFYEDESSKMKFLEPISEFDELMNIKQVRRVIRTVDQIIFDTSEKISDGNFDKVYGTTIDSNGLDKFKE